MQLNSAPSFNKFLRSVFAGVLLTSALAIGASHAADLPRVSGEYAKPSASATKAAQKLVMSGTMAMREAAATIELAPIADAKVEAVKKSNSQRSGTKAMQIGISREMTEEAPDKISPTLKWSALPDGGKVAYLKVKSAAAKSLRIGLDLNAMPDGVEMRFIGADNSSEASAYAAAKELNDLKDAQNLYWTPVTDGDTQTIEIFAAKGIDTNALKFKVRTISHMIASAKDGFSGLKAVGDCTIDVACAPQTQAFNNLKESVAHIVFQAGCGPGGSIASCVCTGTLLNDSDTSTQIPYFWSASHCITTQTIANTINSFWFYQNPTCQNPRTSDVRSSSFPRVTGGATLLYANVDTDGAFLRLNGAPPAGVFYSGWDANTIAVGENVTVVHHSDGDPKRYSLGVVDQFRSAPEIGANGSFAGVRYTLSTVLGGGSGGGIFSFANGEYFLRGGLLGGTASCSNSGQPASAGNLDVYSRFDQIFPSIRQFLLPAAGGRTNYTDMWWNPNESGWGFQVTHHNNGTTNNIFGTWYTYDQAGNQLFITMTGCDLQAFDNTTCRGRLYRVTGTPYNVPVFAGTRTVTEIGTGTLRFNDANNGTFSFTIGGTSLTKAITRFPFGTGFAQFPNDASDIYYQADASGWGYSLAQHGAGIFGVIYHYDEVGNPMWVTLSGNLAGNSASGTLFRARSNGNSHYLSPTWRASDITAIPVGDATMTLNASNMSLRFLISGYQQTRTLTRLPF